MVAGGALDLREDRLLFGFNHVYGGEGAHEGFNHVYGGEGAHEGSAGARRGPLAGAGGGEDAPYADRSAVCPAAIHAGVVGASGGGAQVGARPGARARAPARAACRPLTRAGARQCFSLQLGGGRARYVGAPRHGVEALSLDLSWSADPARAAAFSFGVAPSATLCPQQLRWHLATSPLLLAAAAVAMSPPPFLLWAFLASAPPPPPSRTNWTRLVPPSRTNWTRPRPRPEERRARGRPAAARAAAPSGSQ